MTMLAASQMEQSEHSLLGMCDDFSSYFHQAADSLYIDTNNWFNSLLDERNYFSSVSSSACPSITSELSDFDALMNESFSQETLERADDQAEPRSPSCKRNKNRDNNGNNIRRTKNSESKLRNPHSKWSSFSANEKTELLEELMETVSEKLGLREQLDIIKIIDPDARLTSTDTEFFIDFDLMDDRKYELVKLYVDKEQRRENLSKPIEKTKTSLKCDSSDKLLKQKRKIVQQKEILKKRDKLKACRQLRKERKSGLFSREQVIAMASFTVSEKCESEEEEVDILS